MSNYSLKEVAIKVQDILSAPSDTTQPQSINIGTGVFMPTLNSVVEGGQAYFALPGISNSNILADLEGNSWSIDCFKDASDNLIYMRFFSPMSRGSSGPFGPILFTTRGGIYGNGFVNRHYASSSYSRTSASHGDVLLKPNTGGTFSVGESFSLSGLATGNPVFHGMNPGANAGMRIRTFYNSVGGAVTQATGTNDIFVEPGGAMHFTKPFKASNQTIATLDINGVWNTAGGGTSDKRVKTDIESLSESEKKVAKKIKDNIKKFRRIDLEDKDGLRIGVIAQEVEEYFKEEGLNVFDYRILDTKKTYALFKEDKIEEYVTPAELSNSDPDQERSVTKLVLKDGRELIGRVSNYFCDEDCEKFIKEGGTKEEYCAQQVFFQNDDERLIVDRCDIVSQKRLPPEGFVEIDFYTIDPDQLFFFMLSAL